VQQGQAPGLAGIGRLQRSAGNRATMAVFRVAQREPQTRQRIRRDDKANPQEKSANLYFVVGDNALNIGAAVFVKDMEALKTELMKSSGAGGTWTLSMTMHGAETFFALSGRDVSPGGLTENDPKAYNKARVQRIFGDAKFQGWRKKYGPKRINFLSCQIGKELEETFLQLVQHPTSTQRAAGLGQGCLLLLTAEPINIGGRSISARATYEALVEKDKQAFDEKLAQVNDDYGYNGEKIKRAQLLTYYFDEPPEGQWMKKEVITPKTRSRVSYLKRTSSKAFVDECQPSQMKQRHSRVPVPADEE
jgi:hypothetical protein